MAHGYTVPLDPSGALVQENVGSQNQAQKSEESQAGPFVIWMAKETGGDDLYALFDRDVGVEGLHV